MLIPSATAAAVFRLGWPLPPLWLPGRLGLATGVAEGGPGGGGGLGWVGLRSVGLVLDGGRQRVGTRFVVI